MATSTVDGDAPKSSKPLLLAALLATGVLLAAGGGAAWYLSGRQPAAPAAPVTPPPIFVVVEPITVNLQANGRGRFLHTGITLRVADADSQARMAQYQPELRSRILTLLANRDGESLLTAQDKDRLAAEILESVNRPFADTLPPQQVTNVMFTAFVLQ